MYSKFPDIRGMKSEIHDFKVLNAFHCIALHFIFRYYCVHLSLFLYYLLLGSVHFVKIIKKLLGILYCIYTCRLFFKISMQKRLSGTDF